MDIPLVYYLYGGSCRGAQPWTRAPLGNTLHALPPREMIPATDIDANTAVLIDTTGGCAPEVGPDSLRVGAGSLPGGGCGRWCLGREPGGDGSMQCYCGVLGIDLATFPGKEALRIVTVAAAILADPLGIATGTSLV